MKLKNFLASFSALAFVATATFAQAKDEPWVKVGGFLDAQYQYKKEATDPGFVLNDGAIYLEKEYEMVKGKVDLPFKGRLNATNTAGGGTATFDFATEKAQAYVGLMPHDNFEIWAGVFDTPFGFEANDSKDLVFTAGGLVGINFVPVTHMGAMVAYDMNGFTAKAVVANPDNSNNLNMDGTAENVEFGAHLGYSNDMFRLGAGMLHHQRRGADGAVNRYSITAGANVAMLTVDAEFEGRKAGGTDMDWGLLGQVVAKATDELSAGARFEYLKKSPTNQSPTGHDKYVNLTFGPQYAMNDNFKFKLDYTWTRNKPFAGAKTNEHGVNAAALFMF